MKAFHFVQHYKRPSVLHDMENRAIHDSGHKLVSKLLGGSAQISYSNENKPIIRFIKVRVNDSTTFSKRVSGGSR